MGDDMERRLAMLEQKVAVNDAVMPRIERTIADIEHKMDTHIEKTESARSATNQKLDKVLGKLESVDKQAREIEKINSTVSGHHDLFQQGKGAWKAAIAIGSAIGAVVTALIALIAKLGGFIRIA
jgi:uncharacterized coiled-coil protein SlyX